MEMVDAEKMYSSDALSSGTPEHANKAVSSEEPPSRTSVLASSTQRQLAMLRELFHAQADEMKELEEELVQLRAHAGSSHPPPPPATVHREFGPPMVQVTPKDVILEAFHGFKDPESLVIDKELFLPPLSWLRVSVMQLRASKQLQPLWASTLLGAWRGAAKKSFTHVHGESHFVTISLALHCS
jgi:hypothetical protein